jgi:predicted GNAT family acetyltransferase
MTVRHCGYDRAMTEPRPSPPGDDIQVVDNPDLSRYEARLGKRLLGIVEYEMEPAGTGIFLIHTEVLPDAEGMGVGSSLAKTVLQDVRTRGLKPTIECQFIGAYVKRHRREYEDLVSG